MEQYAFKNVSNCLNTNIYSYLRSGGQSSNLYLNVVHFFNSSRHLWQLKTAVFLHWSLQYVMFYCTVPSPSEKGSMAKV